MNYRQIIKKNWGLNKKKINLILGFIGISNPTKSLIPEKIVKDLDLTLSKFISQKLDLKHKIKYWTSLRLIKGIRRTQGLTVNGQNVKRNAKTQKKLFKSRLL